MNEEGQCESHPGLHPQPGPHDGDVCAYICV